MNKTIEQFARQQIKQKLARCTFEQQKLFKRMYSPQNIDALLVDVCDNMPTEKLDWALTQIEHTLKKT